MLTWEEDVELSALVNRGWSVSAIARHLGRDPKTVRAYIRGERTPGVRARSLPDAFARYEHYVFLRLKEDPHLWATTLYDEVTNLGYERSYQRFTHEIRARSLRPRCDTCARKSAATIEIEHEPGEEMQFDWLELPDAPWGEDAHVLVASLPYSGKARACFEEREDQAHLIGAIDRVLRRFSGSARRWRVDRIATVVDPGSGTLVPSFAPVAKHYGVAVDVCPPRRAKRKGSVEKTNHFITQRWWRTARVHTMNQAQRSLDRFLQTTGDARRRGDTTVGELAKDEVLMALPADPYPATIEADVTVGPSALVAFCGNHYSVPPGFIGAQVTVRHRLGSQALQVLSRSGIVIATHERAAPGAGKRVRTVEHHRALEELVLASFTTAARCRRKANRPPSHEALAEAARLSGLDEHDVVIDLSRYAEFAELR